MPARIDRSIGQTIDVTDSLTYYTLIEYRQPGQGWRASSSCWRPRPPRWRLRTRTRSTSKWVGGRVGLPVGRMQMRPFGRRGNWLPTECNRPSDRQPPVQHTPQAHADQDDQGRQRRHPGAGRRGQPPRGLLRLAGGHGTYVCMRVCVCVLGMEDGRMIWWGLS